MNDSMGQASGQRVGAEAVALATETGHTLG